MVQLMDRSWECNVVLETGELSSFSAPLTQAIETECSGKSKALKWGEERIHEPEGLIAQVVDFQPSSQRGSLPFSQRQREMIFYLFV